MKTLTEFYDRLPEIDCKGHCHDQCTVAPLGAEEADYIADKYGEENVPEPEDDLVCSSLDRETKNCTVYDRRPLICRIFGLTKKLRCPYGCVPDRWLAEHKARQLIDIIIRDRGEQRAGQSEFMKRIKSDQKSS